MASTGDLCKEIKPVNPEGSQPWIFFGSTDSEAEAPILWPPGVKSWLIGEDPDAGEDWKQEKGTTEDEMVGWLHWLNEYEFEQTLEDSGGQRSLACCRPWGCKELDTTELLNSNKLPSTVPGYVGSTQKMLKEWGSLDRGPTWCFEVFQLFLLPLPRKAGGAEDSLVASSILLLGLTWMEFLLKRSCNVWVTLKTNGPRWC